MALSAGDLASPKSDEIPPVSISGGQEPVIALLPWGNVLEDFLDKIGVSLDAFCVEFTGSWMFGYVSALRRAGVRTVLICMSNRVSVPSHFSHAPTGAAISILPVSRMYRAMQSRMNNPYGRTV